MAENKFKEILKQRYGTKRTSSVIEKIDPEEIESDKKKVFDQIREVRKLRRSGDASKAISIRLKMAAEKARKVRKKEDLADKQNKQEKESKR